MQQFCPHCFHLLTNKEQTCSACGTDIGQWDSSAQDFDTRLIQALQHPVGDVRLRAIYALGKRDVRPAGTALVECALSAPADIVQGLAVVTALEHWLPSPDARRALKRLAREHPAKVVREAASNTLR
ncbi:MAG: HEAT repeat domain-containing protein [Gammaproteobacteria bacterium]